MRSGWERGEKGAAEGLVGAEGRDWAGRVAEDLEVAGWAGEG